MKKNQFFHKAIVAMMVALPFPAFGMGPTDGDKTRGSEIALEQLDKFMNVTLDKLKYQAPYDGIAVEAGYAYELLEHFAAKAEVRLVYTAPDDSYETREKEANFIETGYLTQVSKLDWFLLNLL